jgi:hypothetical protein
MNDKILDFGSEDKVHHEKHEVHEVFLYMLF